MANPVNRVIIAVLGYDKHHPIPKHKLLGKTEFHLHKLAKVINFHVVGQNEIQVKLIDSTDELVSRCLKGWWNQLAIKQGKEVQCTCILDDPARGYQRNGGRGKT